jgi:hypothetical protein
MYEKQRDPHQLSITMSIDFYPFFLCVVIFFNDAGRITDGNRIGGDVFSNHSTGRDNAMFANGDARRNNGVSADPAIITDHDRRDAYSLFVDGLFNIGIIMIEATGNDVLGQDNIVPDFHRPDDHIAQADQGVIPDFNIAHTIIDCAEIFDSRMVADRKLIKGDDVHPYPAPDNYASAFLMVKPV